MKLSRIVMVSLVCLAALAQTMFVEAQDSAKKARVLMVTQSKEFTHGPVKRKGEELALSEVAITQLGQTTGLFTTHCTQNAADFTEENLKNYDIVCFYTQAAAPLPIKEEDAKYFVNTWLKQKGHAFVGFHSATDTYRNDNKADAWYRDMIGGTFNGHPWNAGTTVTIKVHEPNHPLMKPFGSEFTNSPSRRAGTVVAPSSSTFACTQQVIAMSRLVAASLRRASSVASRTLLVTGSGLRLATARPTMPRPRARFSWLQESFTSGNLRG